MNEKKKKGRSDAMAPSQFGTVDPNSEIGAKLRAYFSSVQNEPVPERFLDLLEKLDTSERKTNGDVSEA